MTSREPAEHAKSHGNTVADVMITTVISVGEDTPLAELAARLSGATSSRLFIIQADRLVTS
ncbi:hypothetical protein [Mycetohabitans sp. B8]|uniref:hypothetical protein n=1 Tax=Mycetohabitans sp. B8 TaxID=2841845 RepID=UPI001F2CD0C5|nr:hypothetical protein [Mycetohabitans sp. B8]